VHGLFSFFLTVSLIFGYKGITLFVDNGRFRPKKCKIDGRRRAKTPTADGFVHEEGIFSRKMSTFVARLGKSKISKR
jgi:hypothetical protein